MAKTIDPDAIVINESALLANASDVDDASLTVENLSATNGGIIDNGDD